MRDIRLCYYGHFDLISDCENWIANALSRAGVLVYRWQRKIKNQLTVQNQNDWDFFHLWLIENDIDVVLFSKAPEIQPMWLNQLRNNRIKIIWWTFDYMGQPGIKEWFIPLAQMSDLCFMTDGVDSDGFYAGHRINRVELHQGFEKGIHDIEVEDYGLGADILFLGSAYTKERVDLINFLKIRYPVGFKHYGNRNALKDGLWGREFCSAIQHSKIIIGDNFRNDIPGYWSDRIYLTLAAQGFFMPRWVMGFGDEFKNECHVVWWEQLDELKKLIDKYLGLPDIRNRIAFEGWKLVTFRDSYDNRIQVFLKYLEEIL